MKLLLVSGRYDAGGDRHAADLALAQELVGLGCEVRLVLPRPTGASAPTVVDGTVVTVCTAAPGFAAVEGRLLDPPLERAVAEEVRRDLPDAVHLLDYGGACSVNASWVASRLGARTLVSVRAAPTLCHRGDLVFVDGSSCQDWTDARRCATCCTTPGRGGLSRAAAAGAALLRVIRSPWNPYPTARAFENRRELLLGGLQVADRVCVESAAEAEQIRSLGIHGDRIAVCPRSTPAGDWLAAYRSVAQRTKCGPALRDRAGPRP